MFFFQEHQTKDWKRHKRLCSYLSTAAEEVGAETFFGREFRFVDSAETEANDVIVGDSDAGGLDEVEKELGKLDLETKDEEKSSKSKSTTEQKSEAEVEETDVVEEEEEDKAATWKTWTKFRVNAVKMCEILMNKKLEEWEKVVTYLLISLKLWLGTKASNFKPFNSAFPSLSFG